MGKRCCFCGTKKEHHPKRKHELPSDEKVREKWIKALGLTTSDLALRKKNYVCSDHFRPEDYEYFGGHLKKQSVPNKNLAYEESASYSLYNFVQENYSVKSLGGVSLEQDKLRDDSDIFADSRSEGNNQIHNQSGNESGTDFCIVGGVESVLEVILCEKESSSFEFPDQKETPALAEDLDSILEDSKTPAATKGHKNDKEVSKKNTEIVRFNFRRSEFSSQMSFEKFQKYISQLKKKLHSTRVSKSAMAQEIAKLRNSLKETQQKLKDAEIEMENLSKNSGREKRHLFHRS
ncbi:uncharacterized protein LOC123290828 [Chrysoperla carnea]|uniref:uncharacterized protein LOC123290828 n=1 Tax=Chrysoperla carnea TaxID=189513 RepID=UPI001D06A87A|nr:uncharacterized protein LOC123290828 [Chrysoperla carnea]